MISCKGFEAKLNERGIKHSDLTKELGISSRTIAKIGRGEKLSRVIMERLCSYYFLHGSGAVLQGLGQSDPADPPRREGCGDLRQAVPRTADTDDVRLQPHRGKPPE